MNIANNMEAIFVIAIALVSATGFATASASAPQRHNPPVVVQVAADAGMTVVNVTAKRLTAAEKAAL